MGLRTIRALAGKSEMEGVWLYQRLDFRHHRVDEHC